MAVERPLPEWVKREMSKKNSFRSPHKQAAGEEEEGERRLKNKQELNINKNTKKKTFFCLQLFLSLSTSSSTPENVKKKESNVVDDEHKKRKNLLGVGKWNVLFQFTSNEQCEQVWRNPVDKEIPYTCFVVIARWVVLLFLSLFSPFSRSLAWVSSVHAQIHKVGRTNGNEKYATNAWSQRRQERSLTD